jgi:hypothetical protein
MGTAMKSSAYPKEIQAQLATARSQLRAQATVAQGQEGSSGSGEYADQAVSA